MHLDIPLLPSILVGSNEVLWRRWYAFWSLPLALKADIVDLYPELVLEVATAPETVASGGPPVRVYFDPGFFDAHVPNEVVFGKWQSLTATNKPYPLQSYIGTGPYDNEPDNKYFLVRHLTALNYAVLAYKYRYIVRPQNYMDMDFMAALSTAATQDEILTFYERSAY
jgi:hypothetical protein